MVTEPSGAAPCQKSALRDFIATINSSEGALVEIAFADPGTSKYTRAAYLEALDESYLLKIKNSSRNISFVSGLNKEKLEPIVLHSFVTRKSNDSCVELKNIISFDIDFKDNSSSYRPNDRQNLTSSILASLKNSFREYGLKPWMIVFSGNGIHVHFRLKQSFHVKSASEYKAVYTSIREYLEAISGLKFDSACSNPAHLIRLPFSINWKDKDDPISCKILAHDPEADFTSVFKSFESCAKSLQKQPNKGDKASILANLDLLKVLAYFGYSKMDSVSSKANRIVCSSPFSTDKNPSFNYDLHRKIFYDFSIGIGGDLFHLVGHLANISPQQEFKKILQISAEIAGIGLPFSFDSNRMPVALIQAKKGFELISLGSLLLEPDEDIEWLVDGLLPMGGTSLLCGKPKAGKTTLARLLALCIANGENFLQRSTSKGKVIYLALEEKRSQVRRHFEDMGVNGDEEIYIHASAAPFEDTLEQLAAIIAEHRPSLVIIDTLFRFIRVKDVCDYAAITNALEPLNVIARQSNTHLLLVHHMGKGEREGADGVLGSTAITGLVDSIVMVNRKGDVRTICSQQRYGEDLPESILDFDTVTRTSSIGELVDGSANSEIEERILRFLERAGSATEADVRTNIAGKNQARIHALRHLCAISKVVRTGKGGRGDPYQFALAGVSDSVNGGASERFVVPTPACGTGNKKVDVQIDETRTFLEEGEI